MLLISNVRGSQTVRMEICIRFVVVNCPVDLKVIHTATQVIGRSSSHDHAVSRQLSSRGLVQGLMQKAGSGAVAHYKSPGLRLLRFMHCKHT